MNGAAKRILFCLTIAWIGIANSGCALIRDGARLAISKVVESTSDCCERRRNNKWARQAWEKYAVCHPPIANSHSFRDGFEKGFSTYLYQGGNGEPPLVPPRRYRNVQHQNINGTVAAQRWFDGYRAGAGAAMESGIRDLVAIPSSLAIDFQTATPQAEVSEMAPVEEMPPPRMKDSKPVKGHSQSTKDTKVDPLAQPESFISFEMPPPKPVKKNQSSKGSPGNDKPVSILPPKQFRPKGIIGRPVPVLSDGDAQTEAPKQSTPNIPLATLPAVSSQSSIRQRSRAILGVPSAVRTSPKQSPK